jgi:hypothetical protein
MRTILKSRISVKFFLRECQKYIVHMHACMHLTDNVYICNLIDDKIMVGSTGYEYLSETRASLRKS